MQKDQSIIDYIDNNNKSNDKSVNNININNNNDSSKSRKPSIPHSLDPFVSAFIEEKILNPHLSIRQFVTEKQLTYESFLRALNRDPNTWMTILNGIRARYHVRSVEVDAAVLKKALLGDPRAQELWYKKMENWNLPGGQGTTTIHINIPAILLRNSKPGEDSQVVTLSGPKIDSTLPWRDELHDDPEEKIEG